MEEGKAETRSERCTSSERSLVELIMTYDNEKWQIDCYAEMGAAKPGLSGRCHVRFQAFIEK